MNKKLLICGAIATALLITACVKKEEPKQEEQEHVETAASEAAPAEPAKFESLDSADAKEIPAMPAHAEITREETPNTTTVEVRRPAQPEAPKAETAAEAPKAPAKPEAPKAEEKPKAESAKTAPKQNSGAQTEDDAVAAAIAAATPALDN